MITIDDIQLGQVHTIPNQGTNITPVSINVTVCWISFDSILYTVEGSPIIKETSTERFLSILNQSTMSEQNGAGTINPRQDFLLKLADLCEKFDATFTYTREDNGIHVDVCNEEVFVGFLFSSGTEAANALREAAIISA